MDTDRSEGCLPLNLEHMDSGTPLGKGQDYEPSQAEEDWYVPVDCHDTPRGGPLRTIPLAGGEILADAI